MIDTAAQAASVATYQVRVSLRRDQVRLSRGLLSTRLPRGRGQQFRAAGWSLTQPTVTPARSMSFAYSLQPPLAGRELMTRRQHWNGVQASAGGDADVLLSYRQTCNSPAAQKLNDPQGLPLGLKTWMPRAEVI
jgi:hypothetical protein